MAKYLSLQNPESGLLVIQRGLVLLTNHLESFRKRYAFHLRMWQLQGEGIECHKKCTQDKNAVPLRVVLQAAGASEKVDHCADDDILTASPAALLLSNYTSINDMMLNLKHILKKVLFV